ncbi:MAG TPA: tyrosine-type recombinase/integrase, partial [Trebonia sp.]
MRPPAGTLVSLETAGRALGIGRTKAYQLACEGQFPVPVIRAGRAWLVPVAVPLPGPGNGPRGGPDDRAPGTSTRRDQAMAEGSTYKKCSCRADDGTRLGTGCPKLRRANGAWSATYGTWYYQLELPPGPGGARRSPLRRGGFATDTGTGTDAEAQLGRARELLAIADIDDDQAVSRIADALTGYLARERRLPDADWVRKAVRAGHDPSVAPPATGKWPTGWLAAARAVGGRVNHVDIWLSVPRPSPVMVWIPNRPGCSCPPRPVTGSARCGGCTPPGACAGARGCGLHRPDTDLAAASTTIRWQITQLGWEAVQGPSKSDVGERQVALDADTVAEFRAHRARQDRERKAADDDWNSSAFEFTDETGDPLHPADVADMFHMLAYLAGLPPIRLHDLRHGAAALLLAAGHEMKVVRETLGLSSITIAADTCISILPRLARRGA